MAEKKSHFGNGSAKIPDFDKMPANLNPYSSYYNSETYRFSLKLPLFCIHPRNATFANPEKMQS